MEIENEIYDTVKWDLKQAKAKAFLRKWEERRKSKMKFAFLHGSLDWRSLLLGAIIVYYNLHNDRMELTVGTSIVALLIILGGGFLSGLFRYKKMESLYQQYLRNIEK